MSIETRLLKSLSVQGLSSFACACFFLFEGSWNNKSSTGTIGDGRAMTMQLVNSNQQQMLI
jgi:hypothetical protein